MRRRLAVVPLALVMAFGVAACGDTAQEACTKLAPGSQAQEVSDDEAICMKNGSPVVQVEDEGYGYEGDD